MPEHYGYLPNYADSIEFTLDPTPKLTYRASPLRVAAVALAGGLALTWWKHRR